MAVSLLEETRAALQRISTATITLQLLKRGVRNVYMRGVAPLAPPSERLVGVATTLRFIPMREDMSTPDILADRENPQRVAIDTIDPGAILVIDARGVSDCAALGDILAERIKQRGGGGVVTDGGVRDASAVADVGLPVFAAGPAAPASLAAHTPVDRDLPVGCGGVAVVPGDVLVGADQHGTLRPDSAGVAPGFVSRDVEPDPHVRERNLPRGGSRFAETTAS